MKYNIIFTLDCCTYNIINKGVTFNFYDEIINPGLKYIELCKKHNFKICFFFEIFSYMRLTEYDEFKKTVSDLENFLILAHELGHDIQIHPHAGWVNAKYKDKKWYRGGNTPDDIVGDLIEPNKKEIFDSYFALYDRAISRLKTLLKDWEPIIFRAMATNGWDGVQNMVPEHKKIFLTKLKERGIISTSNHYTDDSRYASEFSSNGFAKIDDFLEIPMSRSNGRYASMDYIGQPSKKRWTIDASHWVFSSKSCKNNMVILNYYGHLKNCYGSRLSDGNYKELPSNWEERDLFFERISKNPDFINSSVSSLVKKLMDHNINTILLPVKEYKNIWNASSNSNLTTEKGTSAYIENYKKEYTETLNKNLLTLPGCSGYRGKIYNKYNKFLFSIIPDQCKSIVDMCCGAGALSKMLHDKNYKVCGVDLDNNAIKISKSRYPDVNFEVGDIRKWKPKEQVDCVIIIDCLTEFNPVAVKSIVKHLKTYIKKNGYLLITWTISNRYVFPTKEGGIHKRVFTFKQELLDEMPLDTYFEWSSVDWENQHDMNKAILMMKNI